MFGVKQRWREPGSPNWLIGGVHLAICWGAIEVSKSLESETQAFVVWAWAFVAMALVSFFAWIANYKRRQQMIGTPTSKVVSAAQGYVELQGYVEADDGALLISPITETSCVWYSFVTKEKRGSGEDAQWVIVDSGQSDVAVILDDDSGKAAVQLQDAEVVTTHKRDVREGNLHHTEWLLLLNEPIYAIGEFATVGGAAGVFDVQADVGQLLAEWKQSPAELLKRFDLNNDGQIDLVEWELARRQARREVEKRHAEIRNQPGTHILRKPKDGRYFLVSNLTPQKLSRRYLIWAWAHTIVAVASAGAAFYFFTHRHL